MTLHQQIQSLVAKFAQDLEGLVRSAAVSAVQSALGSAQTVSAPTAAAGTGRKRGRGSKKSAAVAPRPTKSPKGKRVRRTPADIANTANKIHAYVKAHPNTNAEAIKKALGIAKSEWLVPLASLMEAKRLSSKGQKRATTYTAR